MKPKISAALLAIAALEGLYLIDLNLY